MGRRRKKKEVVEEDFLTPSIIEFWSTTFVGGSGLNTKIQYTLKEMALRIIALEKTSDIKVSIVPGFYNENDTVGYGEILSSLPYTIKILTHDWKGFDGTNYELSFSVNLESPETLTTLLNWKDENSPRLSGLDNIRIQFSKDGTN